jgi:tocopherol O-methyltransferase
MIISANEQTSAAVAQHYDELDPFYRELWGDHVHHGLWSTGLENPAQAVENLIACVARCLELNPGERVCDVGCGYGATAQWLAEHHGVHVTGLTISAVQAQRASARSAGSSLLRFLRQDWLDNGFDSASFDHIVAIESSEHMADKQHFFDEAHRTLRPGGHIVVCTWLARSDPSPWEVRHLLEPICREGRLPSLGSEVAYRKFAEQAGFTVETFEDLSLRVRRTWRVCAGRLARKLLVDRRYRRFLRDARSGNRIFALTLLRIWAAYQIRSIRYGLLVARKSSRADRRPTSVRARRSGAELRYRDGATTAADPPDACFLNGPLVAIQIQLRRAGSADVPA